MLVQYKRCEWNDEKYGLRRVFFDTKLVTLLRRKFALDSLAANMEMCLLNDKYSSKYTPDSYPKIVLNIKSNSMRYSNYSSLCVDSVNEELMFCFKLYTNFQHFLVDIGII
jgi:hypothetical protein